MAMIETSAAGGWRHFPRYMMLAMAVVFAVNARFIYVAVNTFPGAASGDDFDTSNRYDAVLAAKAAQDRLGWHAMAQLRGAVPVVTLTGPDGAVLANAVITAQAERPIGTQAPIDLSFHRANGAYVGDNVLPGSGQWDLRLVMRQGGHVVKVTRRVIAP